MSWLSTKNYFTNFNGICIVLKPAWNRIYPAMLVHRLRRRPYIKPTIEIYALFVLFVSFFVGQKLR